MGEAHIADVHLGELGLRKLAGVDHRIDHGHRWRASCEDRIGRIVAELVDWEGGDTGQVEFGHAEADHAEFDHVEAGRKRAGRVGFAEGHQEEEEGTNCSAQHMVGSR